MPLLASLHRCPCCHRRKFATWLSATSAPSSSARLSLAMLVSATPCHSTSSTGQRLSWMRRGAGIGAWLGSRCLPTRNCSRYEYDVWDYVRRVTGYEGRRHWDMLSQKLSCLTLSLHCLLLCLCDCKTSLGPSLEYPTCHNCYSKNRCGVIIRNTLWTQSKHTPFNHDFDSCFLPACCCFCPGVGPARPDQQANTHRPSVYLTLPTALPAALCLQMCKHSS